MTAGALQFEPEPGDLGHDGHSLDAPWPPESGSLGTTTVCAATFNENNDLRDRVSRWQLLRTAQRILGPLAVPLRRKKTESQAEFEARQAATPPRRHRTAWCQNRLSKDRDNREAIRVRVWRTERRAWFANVQVCGSPWTCPVCSARIAQVRRRYLQELERCAAEQGLGIGLHTLTVPHGAGDNLEQLLEQLGEARRRMRSGRAWQQFRQRWGWIGEARTLELTHGVNGWHPHFHAMHFSERAPAEGEEREQFHRELHALWADACRRVGLGAPTLDHGVDVQWGSSNRNALIADYISKWGFAGEVTAAQSKWRSKGGRTPWQLLAGAASSRRDAWLWVQYAQALQGRRQLMITPGLEQRLQPIQQELDDFEAAQPEQEPDPEEVPEAVASIDAIDWHLVVRYRAHESVLEAAMEGSESLEGLLADLRRRSRPPD